jgi:hypothetical protein
MREIQQIESYLHKQMEPSEAVLMEAKLLLDNELNEKVNWQKQSYALAKFYGRKQLRSEIETVHNCLFTEKRFEKFRNVVLTLFKY